MSMKNKAIRKSNPTGLYVVNVYDANGHFTGDKFLVRTLKDAVGETAARIGEGGFGFTADGYFIFPPFGHVKAKGNDGAADFRKYRMAAAGKKNAGTARARGAKSKLQKMGERMGRYGKREENPDIHIDIGSHNTRGRNVRAKNPASKEAAALLDWWEKHVGHREMPGFPNVAAMRKAKREYMMEAGLSEPGRGKNPRSRATADDTAARELYFHGLNSEKIVKNVLPAFMMNEAKKKAAGKYDPAKATKLWAIYAERVAKDYVKEYGGNVKDIFTPATRALSAHYFHDHYIDDVAKLVHSLQEKRKKNPATVHARNKGRERVILVLKGHPKGTGYWTGEGWDTVKAKARIITATNLADVVKMAEKLAKGMPASYRIEVHASGK